MLPLFLAVGFLVTAIGAWLAVKTMGFVGRATKATGKYVDSNTQLTQVGVRSATYPVIEFTAADGRAVRFERRATSVAPGRLIGTSVALLYEPQKPEEAVVDSFVELWLPPLIFLSVGGMWVLGAGIAMLAGFVPSN